MPFLDRFTGAARLALRLGLIVGIAAWAFDVPGRIGLALYTEQYLALVIGLSTALVLLETGDGERAPPVRWAGIVFAAVVCALFAYVAVHYPRLQLSLAAAPPPAVALGLIMIAGVLEATRRKTCQNFRIFEAFIAELWDKNLESVSAVRIRLALFSLLRGFSRRFTLP